MKKGYFCLIFLLILLSGCRENVIVISDSWWESYTETGEDIYPDWKGIIHEAGYSPKVLTNPPSEEEWVEILKKREPAFLLWGPIWGVEAYSFASTHPEYSSILAFPPGRGDEIPENVTHLSPLRLEAYRETGKNLGRLSGGEGLVLSVFYIGEPGREAEYEAYLEGLTSYRCEHEEITFKRQESFQSALDSLNRFSEKNVRFMFISAGGRTSDFYNSAFKKISGRIFVEIPDLPEKTVEESPSIMHYLWRETIFSVLEKNTGEWKREYDVPVLINPGIN